MDTNNSIDNLIKKGLSMKQALIILVVVIFSGHLFYSEYTKPPKSTLTDTELDQLYEKRQKETAEQVKKIHNTKITMADVLGTNLPPRPVDPDATVQGYDVNNNGVRDDVELDIFREYPNSQKTRAVLLQYALTQHMRMTQPIANEAIVNAVSSENSRAYACVRNILNIPPEGFQNDTEGFNKASRLGDELREFIQKRQNNTEARKKAIDKLYKGNFTGGENVGDVCDIDVSRLPN